MCQIRILSGCKKQPEIKLKKVLMVIDWFNGFYTIKYEGHAFCCMAGEGIFCVEIKVEIEG